jgi:hypothetical protein
MATRKYTEERSARVLDLLEQIDKVNEMISFHRDVSKESLMQQQYEHQKNKFVCDLKTALTAFDVEIEIKQAAIAA